MRECFNCGSPMDGDSILRCYRCDVSEMAETPAGYYNPVLTIPYAEIAKEKIPYIDHSREHVPSPG